MAVAGLCGYCNKAKGSISLSCNHCVCVTCANLNAHASEIKGILKNNAVEEAHTFVYSIKCPECHKDIKQSARIPYDTSSPPVSHHPLLPPSPQALPASQLQSTVLVGLRICTTGFNVERRHTIRQAVELNGGIFYDPLILKECTHLIVLDPKGAKYNSAVKAGIACVNEKWIFDSISSGAIVDDKSYSVLPPPQVAELKPPVSQTQEIKTEPTGDTEPTTAPREEIEEFTNFDGSPSKRLKMQHQPATEIFAQLCFVSEGFNTSERKELYEVISEHGGCILDELNSKILKPDFVVCRTTPKKHQEVLSVSPLWVEWCIKDAKLFDPQSNPIFAPLPMPAPYPSMESVRAAFYGFDETDSSALISLSELLGASCSGPSCERITHIITKPSRLAYLKYEPSIKYLTHYFIVTHEWLFECAKKGARVSENPYKLQLPKREKAAESSRNNQSTITKHEPTRYRSPSPDSSPTNLRRRSRTRSRSPDPIATQVSEDNTRHTRPHSRSDQYPSRREERRSRSRSRGSSRSNSRSRRSTSDGDLRSLASQSRALIKTERPGYYTSFLDNAYNFDHTTNPAMNEAQVAEQLGHILKGAKVYISKKIDMKIQTQLHDLISKIGGIPTWIYNKSVTHYIHEGPGNRTQEFLLVSSNPNQRMVHPMWLLKCVDMGVRVREDFFSPHANPRKSLQILDVPSKWSLPEQQVLLDYKPDKASEHKPRKPTALMRNISFRSLSTLENTTPERGSHPTPHPAKYSRKRNSDSRSEPVRYHSSPDFQTDYAPPDASNTFESGEAKKESQERSPQKISTDVEQFTLALRALADQVQKMDTVIPPPQNVFEPPLPQSAAKKNLNRSLLEYTPPKLTPASSNTSSSGSSRNSQMVEIDYKEQRRIRAELLEKISRR